MSTNPVNSFMSKYLLDARQGYPSPLHTPKNNEGKAADENEGKVAQQSNHALRQYWNGQPHAQPPVQQQQPVQNNVAVQISWNGQLVAQPPVQQQQPVQNNVVQPPVQQTTHVTATPGPAPKQGPRIHVGRGHTATARWTGI